MANSSIIDIKDILTDYSNEIQDGIEEIALNVAKEDVYKLKNATNTYKVRSGKYNKGWTYKKERLNSYSFEYIVHNKDNYQLTHLLEKGHRVIGRNGTVVGQTRAFPHIAPVEEISNRTYETEVENLIKNGG